MSEFRVTVCSLPDYEDLVAEIYIGDEFVALLSQERGPDAMAVEIAPRRTPFTTDLSTFEEAMSHAKKRLWELRKGS